MAGLLTPAAYNARMPHALEQFVTAYGYLALFVGTFLEGEIIVALAGFLAHQGYLEPRWVAVSAFAGTLCGDQLYFHIGRHGGERWLERRPAWQPRLAVVRSHIHRHQNWLMLSFRFVYGLRTITPFALGAAQISPWRFLAFNVVSASAWAILFTVLRYYFGQAVSILLKDVHTFELAALALFATLALAFWLVRTMRLRRRDREPLA